MASTAVSSISRPPQARGNPEGQVPPSLAGVERFLLAADEIQHLRPRVAYLCRFHAFEAAHELDKTSSGRGVRQFKTALLERLEEENGPSLAARLRSTDLREIQSFYKEYYDSYVKALEDENADRAGLAQAYHTASVLFEVLCALDRKAKPEEKVAPEDLVSGQNLQEKAAEIIPFNILPLDAAGASLAIMQLPEIRVAVDALKQISGLPRPPGTRRANRQVLDWDILDWLESTFGFQKDNVRNQREHLILLLANAHARLRKPPPDPNGPLDGRAIKEVMNKVFKNYKQWCKFLGRKKNLTLPNAPEEVPQRQILYTALFLLIWGEAGNLRFMPECLAYIFHNMGWEVIGMLGGNVSLVTGQNVQPAYPGPGLGGSDKAFLLNVVTPIYEVVRKESENNGGGKAPHQDWRNYDDINEYFWKPKCFTAVSWPLKLDSNFFVSKEPVKGRGSAAKRVVPKGLQRERKANFVEYRSFWHLWRSWDRMWTFFILLLQALIIIAYSPKWHSFLTDMYEFKKLISVFITAAALRLLQGVLDVWFSLGLYRTMKGTTMLRLLSKLVVSLVWLILFVVLYVHMWDNPAGFAKNLKSLALQNFNSRDLYISLCAIYLLPNALALVLFSFPLIKRQLEMSNWRIIRFSLWWSQTSLYVGRGMHESTWSLLKYSLFWVALLTCKALFSYNLQIKPLVKPTRAISNNKNLYYEWAEICPGCNHNAGAILAIWAPVVIVYFLDTQIWYAIFSTIVGGTYGAFQRLGEIRTLGMLRSRFRSLPGAFNDNLIPAPVVAPRRFALARTFRKIDTKEQATKFAQLWNEVITSFREEDLISNREYDLMLVPYSAIELGSEVVQWPPFLLASKIYKAVQTAAEHNGSDAELWRKIKADEYMRCAVEECYASLKLLFDDLIEGSQEKWVIKALFEEAERTMMQGFVSTFRLEKLPKFHQKVVELTELLLKPDPANRSKVIRVLQDMFEVVTQDMLSDEARAALEISGALSKSKTSQLFATLQPKPAVAYPPQPSPAFEEQIKRFHLLLTIKDAAQDVPANLEARRRISFFTNSLFMNMPRAPQVKNMVSFSVMTPYYSEIVTYSKKELYEENEDGISTLFYLQKIYPDEWSNFLERIECKNEEEALAKDDGKEIRLWASYKGQTLARTVRGMMYYRRALQLQAFFDAATPQQIEEGYLSITQAADDLKKNQRSMWAHINAVADMKFTYVAACQIYGTQKRKNQKEAVDIFDLMKKNEAFRVAYIDEKEIEEHGKTRKEYYSVLVKADANGLEQEIYRIMLPGMVKLGEGKPENQNHAIVFTRGEALQTIDMNQDHYLEETFKMRNLLEEFHENHGIRPATILGVREHIFTGGVSSLAWFMSQQEMSFVTIGQRVLANPLKVRFHYGHPDVFDRLFHITRGGISKASRVINLSEDIFAGFNSTLRRGNVTHHEYIQVGKGRDVGLNQVSLFEAKVANGNGEQILSRDVYRLGHRLDFMRMMSAWFTTVGFFFNTMLVVLCLYAFLYGKFYLVMSGIQFSLEQQAKITSNASLLSAINTVSLVQIGLLMGLPMVMEMGLEQGFRQALLNFIMMQLQLASVFFTFSMGTKTHYFGRTVLHGGAKYRATGRGFVVRHEKFAENYRLYSRSHFVKALELLLLLIVWNAYGSFEGGSASYGLLTFSLYFLVCSWLFAPFLFNPSGFDWQKTVEDYDDWIKWLGHKGGIGVNANESWESWWAEEQEHLQYTGFWGKLWEVALSLRFFLFQYGVVYQMNVTHGNKAAWVYAVSWIVVVAFLILLKIVSFGRKRFSADFQLMFRLVKALAFIAAVVTLSLCLVFTRLTFRDLFSSILAFVPTGWGLLSIALVFKPTLKTLGLWDSVRAMARTYEYGMGIFIFAPVAVLAWLPFVSTIQTRLLFNTAFSRGLQISRILAGRKR